MTPQFDYSKDVPLRVHPLLQDFFDKTPRELAIKTRVNYAWAWNRFFNFVKDQQITPELYRAWIRMMFDDLVSPPTIRLIERCMRVVFEFLIETNRLNTPKDHLGKPTNPYLWREKYFVPKRMKKPQTVTWEEYQQMRDAASPSNHARWLITALYYTGANVGDICILKWEHVDMENLLFRFPRQKNARLAGNAPDCIIPFEVEGEVHQYLRLLRKLADESKDPMAKIYIAPNLAKTHLKPNGCRVRYIIEEISRITGIHKGGFRLFRYTHMSRWVNSGQNNALGMVTTGHVSPAQFTDYASPDMDALRKQHQAALDYWKKSGPKTLNFVPTIVKTNDNT